MKEKNYKILNILLTLAGVLFSGYMSSVKFFTSNCAFDEPCPLFLGYPACYFGFGMFVTMFIAALLGPQRLVLRIVSLGGICFAGYFVLAEIQRYRAGGSTGALVLPTCAYGLIFFTLIFAVSWIRPKAIS
jgi:disulfide bond formation protein DsbB